MNENRGFVADHEPDRDTDKSVETHRGEAPTRGATREPSGVRAIAPAFEDPLHRFLHGEGELEHVADGRAFSLWEAYAFFGEEHWPIVVGDVVLTEQDVEGQVALIVGSGDPGHLFWRHSDEMRERVFAKLADSGRDEEGFVLEVFAAIKRKRARPAEEWR